MRWMGWLLLALAALVLVASQLPGDPGDLSNPPSSNWRRTANGWEHLNLRAEGDDLREAKLHPLVVGSLEILLTLGALVAFSTDRSGGKVADQGR